jgi:hypothetical protein
MPLRLRLGQHQKRHQFDDGERVHQPDDRLQWGWLSLPQQSPLNAPAGSSNETYQHILILFH